jgi:hypothetical protein
MKPSSLLQSALIGILLFGASGCHSKSAPTSENFIAGLNKHFIDHPDCLLSNVRFPYETSDKKETTQLDSLVKSTLLEKTMETAIHVSRYTIATAGMRYAPRFCYGHRVIDTINSSTPLTVANGFKQTKVTYHYTMQEVPVWAKSPEVLKAYPDMAKAVNDGGTGSATLAQTAVGWQVPD